MTFRILHGLPISPGIAFGRVHALDRRQITVPRFRVMPENRNQERERFEAAVADSERQLQDLETRSHSDRGFGAVTNLLRAHAMILRDGAFFDAVIDRVMQEGQNAEWAVRSTVREVKKLFDHLEHHYFRERRSDVDVVGDRVLRNLMGIEPDPLANLPQGAVIVAHDLTPADTLALGRASVAAFVTEGGGRTSHTAILARALAVPCVLAVPGLLDAAVQDTPVIVDGGLGTVVLEPAEADQSRYRGLAHRRAKEEQTLLSDRDLPAETQDGHRIRLLGNLEVRQEVQSILQVGAEGIGLYRTEFLHIDEVEVKSAEAHAAVYAAVLSQMKGMPVTIRTLDLGGDKRVAPTFPLEPEPDARGTSPLGVRAIRISLQEPANFRIQLEGILRASAHGPVRLMFPFVTDLSELLAAKQLLGRAQDDLRARGIPFDPHMPVGIMIETPAAVFCIDHLQQHCDFFAVGTNDLIALVMAADRNDEEVSHLYRPSHPAVLRVLAAIRERSRIPVSLCGEVAADPFMAPLLVGLGFDQLSMTAVSIPVVKRMIRRLHASACRDLVERALQLESADAVEECTADHLKQWVPDLFGVKAPGQIEL